MQPAFFDNRTAILKDDLVREMRAGSVVSVDVGTVLKKTAADARAETYHFEKKRTKEVQPSKRNTAYKAQRQAKAELSALKGE